TLLRCIGAIGERRADSPDRLQCVHRKLLSAQASFEPRRTRRFFEPRRARRTRRKPFLSSRGATRRGVCFCDRRDERERARTACATAYKTESARASVEIPCGARDGRSISLSSATTAPSVVNDRLSLPS